jgi:hypothetical protein
MFIILLPFLIAAIGMIIKLLAVVKKLESELLEKDLLLVRIGWMLTQSQIQSLRKELESKLNKLEGAKGKPQE